ncbi:sulfatase-like hydrolase/transferase [Sphaerochaeta halotolerans]|uniref:sulfatase-like hydrolase/transferase n=1 Tax=Sphaerochaeta halotolerans TaxID=2293840 RepID=UPI0013702B23|nr:sulfatase-like hydrolase/transferase [Sphaerochaeta halotolerans]MXI87713.1 sulfatase-like hydrolase/transferase [Sphaerochaeta halotolerans]
MPRQIVFIMTDTTRKDMLGCYGDTRMKTPNLDSLAQAGIRYNAAYDCQPVCGPARSALFTGTFPHSNGVVANSAPLGLNVKTLGQRLSDHGINAAYTGKWHLDGGDYFGLGICPEGWDPETWYDMHNYLEELSDEDRMRSRKPETAFDERWTEEMTYAHRVSNKAMSYMEKHEAEDFFLVVSYDEPHGPFICPSPFNTMYDGFSFVDSPAFHDNLETKPLLQRLWAGDDLEKSSEELRKSSKMLSLFLGCNSFVDYEIGRVLAQVQKVAPDAMVIFTSDHGDMLGSHHLQTKNAAFYQEITNVPLLIKPATSNERNQGVVVDYPASHIDITPTVLDFFNLPIPKLMEGKSMLAQLDNPEIRINDHVFCEFTRYEVDHDGFGGLQMMRSITNGRWKLTINLMDIDELYDLLTDPHEVVNRIGDDSCRDMRNRLHDLLVEHMDETRDLYRGYQWVARPWRSDRVPTWQNTGLTRQRENEEYEARQWDYDTGLPMEEAVRGKKLYDVKH